MGSLNKYFDFRRSDPILIGNDDFDLQIPCRWHRGLVALLVDDSPCWDIRVVNEYVTLSGFEAVGE